MPNSNSPSHPWITPQWPAPSRVRACSTTRLGGVSLAPFDSLNLGEHVADAPAAVQQNRQRLRETLKLNNEPAWLNQVHGTEVLAAEQVAQGTRPEADGSYTNATNTPCVVMTADCLPVLLTDRSGSCVAAVHAGWRGLQAGVIESAIEKMAVNEQQLLVWLGPAIGPQAFEVGEEVRSAFCDQDAAAVEAFMPQQPGKWLADIYQLARRRLAQRGITEVYGGGLCTYSDAKQFYSYRRDNQTGRMATLIWIDA